MKTFLLSTMLIISVLAVKAQYPTTVTPATNCSVFRNFNNSDEGFSSPSIYSDANDVSFFWNAAAGAEIESSGLSVRTGSLISPSYFLNEEGRVTVGFYYIAPAGTEYRIRVISSIINPPLEILATTANGPVYTPLPSTSGNICLLLTDADLSAGRQIRFEFTFRATQPGNILFDNLSLSVAGGPLPVTFEGFVARKNQDETVKLLWNVGTELNVKGYYVESSMNGVDFTNVGYVTATGSRVYSMDYPNKLMQTMFFRVRNVDIDGSSKYTPIIKVYNREQTDKSIQAYPVPAVDMVTIQHARSADRAVISLAGMDGKILLQKTVMPNTLQTQLNISRLSKGLYIVKYDDGMGDIRTLKLVKN